MVICRISKYGTVFYYETFGIICAARSSDMKTASFHTTDSSLFTLYQSIIFE